MDKPGQGVVRLPDAMLACAPKCGADSFRPRPSFPHCWYLVFCACLCNRQVTVLHLLCCAAWSLRLFCSGERQRLRIRLLAFRGAFSLAQIEGDCAAKSCKALFPLWRYRVL